MIVLVLAIAVFLAAAPAGLAAAPAVTPSVATISEAPDYSSENWADRWDYSNAECAVL